MIEALLKAIKALIDTDTGATGLHTAISGRYYLSRRTTRTSGGGTALCPYLVIESISEAPLSEFSNSYIERPRIQMSVFDDSDGNSPQTCAQTLAKLRALFDGAKLDLSGDGYTTAHAVREGGAGPLRVDEVWMATTDYVFVFGA